MNRTEQAILNFVKHYGEITPDSMKKFFGITDASWYNFEKKIIGSNIK